MISGLYPTNVHIFWLYTPSYIYLGKLDYFTNLTLAVIWGWYPLLTSIYGARSWLGRYNLPRYIHAYIYIYISIYLGKKHVYIYIYTYVYISICYAHWSIAAPLPSRHLAGQRGTGALAEEVQLVGQALSVASLWSGKDPGNGGRGWRISRENAGKMLGKLWQMTEDMLKTWWKKGERWWNNGGKMVGWWETMMRKMMEDGGKMMENMLQKCWSDL